MASALLKEYDSKYLAEQYSKFCTTGAEFDKTLVSFLGLKPGMKVLDMGCGTGKITSFIADQVGEKGKVVGVDPYKERVKLAINDYSGVQNLSFTVGDSSSQFPYCTEAYYDIFYNNLVFHWLNFEEKVTLLQTAFRCLKPGGLLAMYYDDVLPEINLEVAKLLPDDEMKNYKYPLQSMGKAVVENMIKEAGFEILTSDYNNYDVLFPSVDLFIANTCAFLDLDKRKVLPEKKKNFAKRFAGEDGTVHKLVPMSRIVAKKPTAYTM